MSDYAFPPGVTLSDVSSIMPQPATAMPPGVSDAGALGTSQKYALENHTHASKARKTIATVQSNVVTYTWVYPSAFPNGVIPICNGIAQLAVGTTDLVNVQVDGIPTNTQCVFRITRYSQSFLSLLGINILGVNSAPISVNLHMSALEP